MNEETENQFEILFGSSPTFLATIFVAVLIFVVGVAVLKVIKSAWTEYSAENTDFDETDLFTSGIRILMLLLFIVVIFTS